MTTNYLESGQVTMRSTPTTFQLQAALLAARVLDIAGNSVDSLSKSYDNLATGGLYRTKDLQAGHRMLQRAGLVEVTSSNHKPTSELSQISTLPDDVAAELLLQELLIREPPLWLYAAVVDDEVRWENVPEVDQNALSQLLAEASRRESLLLALGHTLDAELLAERGVAGEDFVVQLCREHLNERNRPDLAATVRRVSLRSDQLGYDVTTSDTAGWRHRLEVKTTSKASGGRVEFFLSRNEATVGVRDLGWSLVVVSRGPDDDLELIGWCSAFHLTPHLPRDLSAQGRWTNVRLSISISEFTPGLPLDGQRQ